MGNNDFSHFTRLGRPTSSPLNAGESQLRQNGEQEQQVTFSGRPTTSCDPENPYLTSLVTSRAVDLRASTSATATSSTVQSSPATENLTNPSFLTETTVGQPITQSSTASVSAITDPIEDPFAALAAYQLTSFGEEQPPLFSGFGISDDFSVTFPEELEAAPSTSQPDASMEKTTEQTTHLPRSFPKEILEELLEAPQETQQFSRRDNNPPASYQGHASAPVPSVMAASGISLSSVRPDVGSFSPSPRPPQSKPPGRRAALPRPLVIGLVNTWRSKEGPYDKYLLRTDSRQRPYMCGFPDCGKTYKSSGHLRLHIFKHTKVSEYRCTYPECGPARYFCSNATLRRHIETTHENWTCVICYRGFNSREILKAHLANEHFDHQSLKE